MKKRVRVYGKQRNGFAEKSSFLDSVPPVVEHNRTGELFNFPFDEENAPNEAVELVFSDLQASGIPNKAPPRRKGRLARMLAAHKPITSSEAPKSDPAETQSTKRLQKNAEALSDKDRLKLLLQSTCDSLVSIPPSPKQQPMLCYKAHAVKKHGAVPPSTHSNEPNEARANLLDQVGSSSPKSGSQSMLIDEGLDSSSGDEAGSAKILTISALRENANAAQFSDELAELEQSFGKSSFAKSELLSLCERFRVEEFAMKLRVFDHVPRFFNFLKSCFRRDKALDSLDSCTELLGLSYLLLQLVQDRRNVALLLEDASCGLLEFIFKLCECNEQSASVAKYNGGYDLGVAQAKKSGHIFKSGAQSLAREQALYSQMHTLCSAETQYPHAMGRCLSLQWFILLEISNSVCKHAYKSDQSIVVLQLAEQLNGIAVPQVLLTKVQDIIGNVAASLCKSNEIGYMNVLKPLTEFCEYVWVADNVSRTTIDSLICSWTRIYTALHSYSKEGGLLALSSLLSASHVYPRLVASKLCEANVLDGLYDAVLGDDIYLSQKFVVVAHLVNIAEQSAKPFVFDSLFTNDGAVFKRLASFAAGESCEECAKASSMKTCLTYFLCMAYFFLFDQASSKISASAQEHLHNLKSCFASQISESLSSQQLFYDAQFKKQQLSGWQVKIEKNAKVSIENFRKVLSRLKSIV